MAHPVAERALAHFNAMFPQDHAETDSGVHSIPVEKLEGDHARPSDYEPGTAMLVRRQYVASAPVDTDMIQIEGGNRPGRYEGNRTARPTLVSLFAGAGGLDIGLEHAGFQSLLATDINHDACESLRANRRLFDLDDAQFDSWAERTVFSQRCHASLPGPEQREFVARIRKSIGGRQTRGPEQVFEGDIRQVPAERILTEIGLRKGELDLLAGGPPCQPFSRAGKREMMETSDGLLFLDFVRLIEDLRPRFFLFENVKGMVIQKSPVKAVKCNDCGYAHLPAFKSIYQLNDGNVFAAGCDNCRSGNAVVRVSEVRGGALQIVENEFRRTGYKIHAEILNAADYGAPQSRERIIIVGSRDGEDFHFPAPTHASMRGQSAQQSMFADDRQPWVTMADSIFSKPHPRFGMLSLDTARLWVKNVVRPHDEPVTWSLDRIAPTVGAHQSAKLAIAPNGVPEAQLQRQQWHVRGRRQGDTPPVAVEHEYLSDEELLVLQTFPPDWYLHGTRMERAFQIGNAVPPVLAKAVGMALLQQMALPVSEAA
jgi:DNA (cytosine-5)-methyltransferase 1